jgi:hypothetical protein
MGFPDSAGANEQHIVVSREESSLRQLQESDLRETRHQGEIKVLQALLVREGRGFEALAQLLLLAARQFALRALPAKSQD